MTDNMWKEKLTKYLVDRKVDHQCTGNSLLFHISFKVYKRQITRIDIHNHIYGDIHISCCPKKELAYFTTSLVIREGYDDYGWLHFKDPEVLKFETEKSSVDMAYMQLLALSDRGYF